MSETNGQAGHADAREAAAQAREVAQAVGRLAELLGRRYRPELVGLDAYRVYAGDRQQAALRGAGAVAARVREFVEAGRTLLLYGTHGTGKDHLLAACLYAACRAGYAVGWADGQELFAGLADAVRARQPKEPLLRLLAQPRVLGLSDPVPSAGSPDDYSVNDLRRLIDRRDRDGKATWLTVNADARAAAAVEQALRAGDRAALAAAYRAARAGIEAALSGAVWSRLSQGAVMLPCFWQDYRKRKFGESTPCTATESTGTTAPTATAGVRAPASTAAPPPR